MSDTYTICLFHVVFSTKERRPLLKTIRTELHPYIAGIARANKFYAKEIGGTNDHVHCLLSLPATMPVSKAVQLIKGGSSKWIGDKFPELRDFAWQAGYGAFSVSISQEPAVKKYIQNQPEHHKKISFQDEFRALLSKHGIEWNEKYVWG